MKRFLSLVLAITILCSVMLPMGLAGAERMYLISDSDTRKLTREELWQWTYESLGYILNEIFARHGYVFEAGGKYEAYFSAMPWYTPNEDSNNSRACYSQMNSVEWYNERLVKEVRQEMRDLGDYNKNGKSVWTNFSTGFSTLQGFSYTELKANQTLPVYSAPSSDSWRGANGKAAVSTNGAIYCGGIENGWMLVMYETNHNGVRVGYINTRKVKGSIPDLKVLNFEYIEATVTGSNVVLTDDPAKSYTTIVKLPGGSVVTYLTTFYNNSAWDYVETTVDGQTVRGFIPAGNLDITMSDSEDADLADEETVG